MHFNKHEQTCGFRRGRRVLLILTSEPLPEDQFEELAAGGEVRVGVRHRPSVGPQAQDAHWGEETRRHAHG